jgi:hypothetical protein
VRHINKIEEKLMSELRKFWSWAEMTPKEYSQGSKAGEWEVDYPGWNDLILCFNDAICLIQEGNRETVLSDLILEVIAVDNEGETLAEQLEEVLDNTALEHIIRQSVSHIQPEARWQIASLIGRKQDPRWKKYLYLFLLDQDTYVQRKTLLALADIDLREASEIAFDKLKDTDEYMRLVSLRVLEQASSEKVSQAIELLSEDKSELIQAELSRLRSNKGHVT